jgi:PAS domain S-box-containing protein
MIFSCLPDGSPDFFNRRWLEYLDLPLEEISGWSWTSVVHPQDLEDLLNKWRSSLVTGEPLEVEARSRRGDGEYRRLLHRAVPLRDEHEIIVKWYVSSIDIEDRRRAEEAVRRSEAYLSEAQHLSHTGSFGCKPASEEMFWSEETFRIFQYDRATKPAVDAILQRVHPEDKALVQERIDRAINESKDCDMEYRLLLPDNSIKHVHVVAHAVKDDPGGFDFVGAVMDVTEHRQATAQLQRAFEEIRALKDRLYQENIALRDEVDRTSMFEEIVGTSRALNAVLSRIAKVAPTDSTVLITGETGTGKELIARAVHKRSQRSGHAFVSVNCAALAPTLISSELFGHEKGAFTGAVQRRLGRFEMADGGTIFLDEVGELLPDTQAALLRVLQERAFERVGGGQPIDVDVRVIAATNRDLRAAVANGTFRQDLLYRLNVFPIEIPPLRERKDDILMLIEYFVQRYATRAGKHIRSIDKKTLDLLQSYDWPGNIRELQNVIERSVILSSSEIFFVDEFWFASEIPAPGRRVEAPKPSSHDRRTEREIIEAALTESRGRVSGPSGAAAKLRIPPSTLETRIKALKINKSQFKFR